AFPSADNRAQHSVVDRPEQLTSNPPGLAPGSAQALVHRGIPLPCRGVVAENVMRDDGHGHGKLLSMRRSHSVLPTISKRSAGGHGPGGGTHVLAAKMLTGARKAERSAGSRVSARLLGSTLGRLPLLERPTDLDQ